MQFIKIINKIISVISGNIFIHSLFVDIVKYYLLIG